MSAPTIAKATRVDRAIERLDAAVMRLESAAKAPVSPASGADGSDAFAALQRENDALRQLNRDAVARVDGIISRLEHLLLGSKAS